MISPQRSLIDLNLKDIWAYRDLLALLIHRDFVSFYKQTILGPLWFFIQPLLTTITFTVIFGQLARLSTDGLPKPLFYMAGITVWNYFAECLNKTSTVFKDNAGIYGKVYFPRLIVPLNIVISNLLRFSIQFVLFLGCLLFYHFKGISFHFTWTIAIFPFIILLSALQGLGLGMIIASLTVKYRDILFLVGFGLQLLMYSTTVIYPLSTTPENLRWIIAANPMTAVIETFRYGVLGKGSFNLMSIGYSFICASFLLLMGIILFNKAEKNFIDTI